LGTRGGRFRVGIELVQVPAVSRVIGLTLVILGVTFSAVGCGTMAPESAWVRAQGGVVRGVCLDRARQACAHFGLSGDRTVRVHVLGSDSIGAYGWADGNVFITRGLVDLLSDRELAAAIAHEMGHLLNDGHLHTVVSLRGCGVSPDAEARADAIGVRLLAGRGIGRDAMVSMLTKVRSTLGASPTCRQRIEQRIELLTDRSRSDR
jgi:Zn-dependent protease with chaperone function